MRHRIGTWTRRTACALPLLLVSGAPALASGRQEDSSHRGALLARELLAHKDGVASEEPGAFDGFHLAPRHGVGYKRSLTVGQHPVVLKLHGPVQSRKSLGLGFQVKF